MLRIHSSKRSFLTFMQSAAIVRSPHNQTTFSIENTQEQEGGTDCGLFVIAYATEFCYGNSPECYRYVINPYCSIIHFPIGTSQSTGAHLLAGSMVT